MMLFCENKGGGGLMAQQEIKPALSITSDVCLSNLISYLKSSVGLSTNKLLSKLLSHNLLMSLRT